MNWRAGLAKLPVLRKTALKDLQADAAVRRLHHVAGRRARPHLHVARPDLRARGLRRGLVAYARALFAAGIRKGDIVHNTFAYHLPSGGWILCRARALGCAVIAAGPGNTEQQLHVIEYLKPTVYVGVPTT